MISRADCPKLFACHLFKRSGSFALPRGTLEQWMIYSLLVASSDSKTNRVPYAIHDLGDVRSKCRASHIEQNGFVTASNIESYAARTDRVFVRYYSADWHGIAFVMIRHQRNLVGCLGISLDLAQYACVWWTPHGVALPDSRGGRPGGRETMVAMFIITMYSISRHGTNGSAAPHDGLPALARLAALARGGRSRPCSPRLDARAVRAVSHVPWPFA